MGIIKELDNRFNEKLGYKQQWVLFECPLCGKQEEKTKMLASSIENCKTCGNKVASLKRTKHGGAGRNKEEPLYLIWRGILSRCYTKSHSSYSKYGGSGVTVCKEWKDDYIAFKEWALSNGYHKSLHIDKDELSELKGIKPSIYSPGTCQWIMQHKNNIIESQLHTNEIEYEIVTKYSKGSLIADLAREYYIGIGKSVSAPTKYIEELLKRYGVFKPRTNKKPIPINLVKAILEDPRTFREKLKEHGISQSKWHRALVKYKAAQS